DARPDEQRATVLRGGEAVRGRLAGLEGDERSKVARRDRARVRTVAREQRVHDALAARVREERLAEPEQAAGRDLVHAVHAAVVPVLHVLQDPAALADELDDRAETVLRDLDLELLVRLLGLAVHHLAD